MRKEMFSHEINILRDTYRRLLRRHAKTNLIKLTRKTHPADLAILPPAPGCNSTSSVPGGQKIATFKVSGTLTLS